MEQLVKINNADVSVREYKGQRVVTFKDIDNVHGRPSGTAHRNFKANKNRFIEGVDYYKLQKDEIRPFGIMSPNGGTILTESGYLMLAKSFTDDLAWKVQRELVNNYFRPQVQPEPECEQLTLETSEYHYFNKTYKGQPVLGTTDIEHLAGISSKSIGWYIREKGGFINGVDYFLLNGQQMADFKAENPMVSRLTVEMYVITKSGFEKLMKLSGRRCEKPKCFIEQKKTAPAPQKWVTADECITALNVLSWIKDYCTHEVEENKAAGDKIASRYEKTLNACNDIIKQVGMMIAAS